MAARGSRRASSINASEWSWWRIAQARLLLADRRNSVAAVAEQLGYQSEAAFRRTFKRVEGVGPGEVRRRG